ncbi:MAG: hypothetical protein ACFB0F_11930 [Neomegalonema sp.]
MAATQRNVIQRGLDYILGRNFAIGLASMMLLAISGFATWRGMPDFIAGIQDNAASVRDPLSGSTAALALAIVVVLTFLMWIALRETVKPQRTGNLILTTPLYVFLVIWSVGFGYGYWWSLIAGSEATRTGLQGQAEDVRDATVGVASRLAAVQSRLDAVVRTSERQMQLEEASGGSCGVASGRGRGPLYRAREGVRNSVQALSEEMNAGWLGSIETDLDELNGRLNTIGDVAGATVAERQQAFERVSAELRGRAAEIATRSDALGQAFASDMRALAGELAVEPGQPGFKCYDPSLAARMNEAANDASEPAKIDLREAKCSEGAAGGANAVMTIWTKLGRGVQSLYTDVPPIDPREAFSGRDLIALLAAIGVDMGLLVLAFINPPALAAATRDAFERNMARVSLASDEVIRELARAMKTAIHDVPGLDLEKVRMHFISHRGEGYFITPNLYRCGDRVGDDQAEDPQAEIRRGVAMNQMAGIFDEYGIIEPMTEDDRKQFWRDDPRRLSPELMEQGLPDAAREKIEGEVEKQLTEAWGEGGEAGLFGKARHALEVAGWSVAARNNPEIWPLKSKVGLTPLLYAVAVASGYDPDNDGLQSGLTDRSEAAALLEGDAVKRIEDKSQGA